MWYGFFLVIFLFCEFLAQFPDFRVLAGRIHGAAADYTSRRGKILVVVVFALLLLLCLEPMGWAPLWNGEVPGHRNQYETIAQAFLKGQLHFDVAADPGLSAMENPYDPNARAEAGVSVQWDHAFYNGKYYMAFGVVPALLLFAPYQLITGQPLTTYHATQVFAGAFLLGLFLLFGYLAKKFFSKMPLWVYLLLTSAIGVMSLWFCADYPALYCTAIMGGVCFMIWSIYLFSRAVFDGNNDRKTFLFAFFGSLCGGLAVGCQNSVGWGMLLVIPLLITFVKTRKPDGKCWGFIALAALPYVAVVAGLLWYNNARFNDPFEFGQSYQITVADQSVYKNAISHIQWKPLLENLKKVFFRADCGVLDRGVFVAFPILLLGFYGLLRKASRQVLGKAGLSLWIPVAVVAAVLIAAFDILHSPYLLTRFTMNYLWLLGIALFVGVGALYQREKVSARLTLVVSLLSVFTILVCVCLFLTPYDANYANHKNLNLAWVNGILKWK